MFFSIIIPTFNAENEISNCLNSICSQTFKDIEVIIVDGQSTDRTIEIATKFAQSIQVKWISEPDNGIYDAMNKGIALATGNYLYFMGSDDTFYDNFVLANVKKKTDLAADEVVYGNVKMIGNNSLVKDGTIYGGEFDLKRLLSTNISHQSIFYHYSIFTKIGLYNTSYVSLADYDFNLKVWAKYPFKYIDLIVANFKVGGASTQLNDEKFKNDKLKNIITYFSKQLTSNTFIPLRFYIQQAIFNTNVNMLTRIYCLYIYTQLKIKSIFN